MWVYSAPGGLLEIEECRGKKVFFNTEVLGRCTTMCVVWPPRAGNENLGSIVFTSARGKLTDRKMCVPRFQSISPECLRNPVGYAGWKCRYAD